MAYNPTTADIVPGMVLATTLHREVVVMGAIQPNGMVLVQTWTDGGSPFETRVHRSTFRWL